MSWLHKCRKWSKTVCIQILILTQLYNKREMKLHPRHCTYNVKDKVHRSMVWSTQNIFHIVYICIYIACLQIKNVYYVRAFFSFDWSVSMGPGGTGSKKSQMSMLSSCELLTIWKSSNWSLNTLPECSYSNKKKINKLLYQEKSARFSRKDNYHTYAS